MSTSIPRTRFWLLRAFGHNPLVRSADRLEARVLVLLATMIVGAVPVACFYGAAVNSANTREYERQNATRHSVSAVLTEDTLTRVNPFGRLVTGHALWRVGGVEHRGVISASRPAKAGERVDVWVDDRGNRISAPGTPSTAATAALLASVGAMVGVIAAATALFAIVRRRMDRRRRLLWDRDIRHFVGDDGGRASSQP
jgi:hypothetical protein